MKKIALIGGGNLGGAILQGLVSGNAVAPANIHSTRSASAFDNTRVSAEAGIILLAVKPHQVEAVLRQIKPVLTEDKILISVAARISLQQLAEWAGRRVAVFRAMPNMAAAHGESMTCLCGSSANEEQAVAVTSLFNSIGKTSWVDESLFNAATVLGGSGIAFAARYARACIQAGIQMGFRAEVAALIAEQTIKGAMDLLLNSPLHPEALIDQVTTPKGCTIAGLNEMEFHGLSASVIKGMEKSCLTLSPVL